MTGANHEKRAEEIQKVAAKVIAREQLSDKDAQWMVFALGMAYRCEIDFSAAAKQREEKEAGR